jgi:hypothetical protein
MSRRRKRAQQSEQPPPSLVLGALAAQGIPKALVVCWTGDQAEAEAIAGRHGALDAVPVDIANTVVWILVRQTPAQPRLLPSSPIT